MLKTLNNQKNILITSLSTSKKRKKMDKSGDLNAKLIRIQDILDTQELQDKIKTEEKVTKEWRAKKAKQASTRAQKAAEQAA